MEKKAWSVVLMVALLATSFLELHARVDVFTALTAGVGGGEDEPCCDECTPFCFPTFPQRCPCIYVRDYCPSECKDGCDCTDSIPPVCTCTVMRENCEVCNSKGIEK